MQLLVIEVQLGSSGIVVGLVGPSREDFCRFLYVPAVIYQEQSVGHPALRVFLSGEKTPLPPLTAKPKLLLLDGRGGM